MSIKAVVTDLDGTLLDSRKELSEETKRVLKECHERGILLIPATGRTIKGVPDFIKALPAVRYLILTNGSRIYDQKRQEMIGGHLLDQELTAKILKYADQYHILYDVYIQGRGVSEERFLFHMDEYKIEPRIQELIRSTRDMVPSIVEHVRRSPYAVEKINFYFDDLKLRQKIRAELGADSRITVSSSLYNNLEIGHCQADKGTAVCELSSLIGLRRGEIMVCGDNDNDMAMMLPGVKKIAVANASEEIKAMADYVTDSNDESGVARAIERFVL